MIREIIGAGAVASLFTNNKRRERRSMTRTGAVGTLGTMAGIGMAYMTYRAMKKR